MADTLPVITSASLNKSNYAVGEDMILTVTGNDPDEEVIEVTVALRSKGSGATSELQTLTATIDELEPVASDSGSRPWTTLSRVGDSFTLKATA